MCDVTSVEEGANITEQQVVDEKTWCESVLPGQLSSCAGQFVLLSPCNQVK